MQTSPVERALRALATVLALASGAAALALAFAICFDIVARRLFAYSVQGTDEYGGYVLAMIGSLGLPYAMLQRAHTRVDLVVPRLAPGVQAALNVAALLSLLLYAGFIAWYASVAFLETIEFDSRANSPLQTPLWVPQGLWAAGAWTFVVVAAWALSDALRLAVRDAAALNRRYGPRTAVHEVSELTHELAQARGAAPPIPQETAR